MKFLVRLLVVLGVILIPVCLQAAAAGFLIGDEFLNGVVNHVIDSKINNSKAFWLLSNMTPTVVLLLLSFAVMIEAIMVSLILRIPYVLAVLRMILINIAMYALDKMFVNDMIMSVYPAGKSSDEIHYAVLMFLFVLAVRVLLSTVLYMVFDFSISKKRLFVAMLCANILSSLFFVFCQIVYYYQNSSAYKSAKAFKENKGKGLFDVFGRF